MARKGRNCRGRWFSSGQARWLHHAGGTHSRTLSEPPHPVTASQYDVAQLLLDSTYNQVKQFARNVDYFTYSNSIQIFSDQMFLRCTFAHVLFGRIRRHGDFATDFTVDLNHDQLGVFNHSLLVSLWPWSGINVAFATQSLPQTEADMWSEWIKHTNHG